MNHRNLAKSLLAFSGIYLCCTNPAGVDEKISEFNDDVSSMSYLSQPEKLDEPVEVAVIDSSESSGDYVCSVKRYKAAPGYNELFLMDPTTDVIYPGALIKGESILTGEYIPIIAKRKPPTISVSLQNISGSPVQTIENPKLSTVREAVNSILSSEITGATPAKVSFEIQDVYSAEQLAIAVQGNYKNSTVNISTGFDFNKQDVRSRLLVKFLQIYYTIDIDLPEQPGDLFEEVPDLDIFGSSSPLYVSTVTYGRMVLFTVESNYSSFEIKAALDAAFSSAVQSGSISVDSRYSNIINSSTLKAYILGGSGSDAVRAVNGIEGIAGFISSGGNYSKDSPGAALSYKLRYLKGNSVANIILTSEYNVRQCQRVSNSYEVKLMHIECTNCDDAGSEAEIFGWLAVTVPGSDPVNLWSVGEDQAQVITNDIGGILTIDVSTRITLKNVDSNTYITLSGNLYEEDTGGDDNLGFSTKDVYVSEFDGRTITLNFNGDGNIAKAIFMITPID